MHSEEKREKYGRCSSFLTDSRVRGLHPYSCPASIASSHPPSSGFQSAQGSVRNMGNFNLFQTHVLTFFHHVEQCCYPLFLLSPHIPAMTSHVAYVIHATITLITTQGLCNITFFLCLSFLFMHFGPYSFMFFTPFLIFSYPCRLTHSV